MPVCVGVADVVDEWSEAILTSINQSPLAPKAGFDDKSLLRLHPLTQLNHSTRLSFDFIDLTLTSSTHTNLVLFFLPPAFEHPKHLRTVGIEINTGQTWSCLLIFAINIYIKATRTLFLCFSSKLVIHLITFSTLSVWYDVGCWFNNFPMLQVNVDEAR